MDLFLQLCRPCGAQFRVLWLPARRLHGRNRRHPGRPRPDRSLSFGGGAVTEITLGIICAALVSRLILVRELSPKLVELVRALTRRADGFATLLLDPDADRERVAAERTELIKAYLDVQAMQRSAYFESADARVLDQPLRRLTQAALELCVMAEAAASHRVGLLPDPEKNASRGNAISYTSEPSAEDGRIVSALVRAADERDSTLRVTRLREGMAAFDRGEELPPPTIACGLWSDPVPPL